MIFKTDIRQVFLHELRFFADEFIELSKISENNLIYEELNANRNLSQNKTKIISKTEEGTVVVIKD